MKIKTISIFLFLVILTLSSCTSAPSINKTPEDTIKNFISAGFKGDKETFKELIRLPQDEDAFVEAYIKIYTQYAAENNASENIKIREVKKEELLEGVFEQMEKEHGYYPTIVEVTEFDQVPLLFLLEKEDEKYYIRNIDTKEKYAYLFIE